MGVVPAVRRWWTDIRASYEQGADEAEGERPLLGYAVLVSTYSVLTAVAAAAAARRGVKERPSGVDLGLLAVATFRVSRTLSKDAVMSPLRAPFATFQRAAGPGEVMEAPRPGHVRHAVGELVTCPFCLSQWVGTAGLAGLALAPRPTRWVTAGFTAVAAADLLHLAYARAQEAAEG